MHRLLFLISFFNFQFNPGLGQVSRNRHHENLDVHRFLTREIRITSVGSRLRLKKIGGITVIDARPDSLSFGLIQSAGSKPVFLQASKGVKLEVEHFLDRYLQFDSAHGPGRIILVLDKLWLSDELNQQKDPYSANRIENIDSEKVYAESASGIAIRAELYFQDQSGYYPLYRYDSTIAGARTVAEYAGGYLQEALVSCVQNLKKWDSAVENLTKSRKLSWEEIDRFNKRKFELPILANTLLREGIYMRFEDFRNNRPSYDRFTVKKNKLTDEIYILDSTDGESIVSNLWGYCDGKNVFIRSLKNFYLLQRVNNSFYFYGAAVLVQINRTFNFPYIPGGSPGANLVNAAALGASIISSKKNAEPGNRAYLLDWDSGSLY